MNLVRIVSIDGNPSRRSQVTRLLLTSGFHVEPFEDAEELPEHGPRAEMLLVHDDRNGALRGLMSRLARAESWVPVVCYASDPTPPTVVGAIRQGAVDYLGWPFTAAEVEVALSFAQGVTPTLAHVKLKELRARSRIDRLTMRERQVLAGVTEGLTNRQIAEYLAISPRTVEIHRNNMIQRMGARSTSEVIRIAVEATLGGHEDISLPRTVATKMGKKLSQ